MTCRSLSSPLGGLILCCNLLSAQTPAPPLTERERALLERVADLERRVAALEGKAAAPASPAAIVANTQTEEATQRGILGLPGTTLNYYFDGYYGWNFNQPAGRVNLLRANDVLSNNLSLNQAALILERAPDVAAGRRYGGRLDLMFGQNTETLQGGAQNEPRPQVYRHIFQAYGTYVMPVGSGLTVDFGKFYGALGIENNYAHDEMNYSRSFYFNYLPFYHMGFRTTYNVNDSISLQHWLVNGANQTEDFNGYKSNAILLTVRPNSAITWNINYYFGREGRDLTPADGRTHIFDTYASWSPVPNLTLAGEFDHVVSRFLADSPPAHVTGGAGYLQYRWTPKLSIAGRFEYLRDRGGLFTGATQDLKEHTLTASYTFFDGFQLRLEHRRDFSNQPFFLTAIPGVRKKEQNTATVGLIWWFGGKREPW